MLCLQTHCTQQTSSLLCYFTGSENSEIHKTSEKLFDNEEINFMTNNPVLQEEEKDTKELMLKIYWQILKKT